MLSPSDNSAPTADDRPVDEPYPAPALGWWALAVFTVALILSYLDRQILTLLVAPVRAELGLSDTQLSVLMGAAFAVLYATAGLPLGRAADLYPRRRLIVIGVVVWSAATFMCGVAESYGELFVARLIVGVGEAALLPAAVSILADYFPPARRGLAMGILIMGAAAGNAVSLVLGSVLLRRIQEGAFAWVPVLGEYADWRVCFFLVALLGIPVALLILSVREPKRRGATGTKPSMQVVKASFKERAPLLVPLYASLAFMGIASMAQVAWMPALFDRIHGIGPAEIGPRLGLALLSGGIIAALVGGASGDWATRRWGLPGRLAVAAAMSLLAIVGSFAGRAGDPELTLLLAGTMVAGTAGGMTVSSAAVQDISNSAIRGIAGSIVSMMGTLIGMGVGPTAVAFLTESVYGDPLALGRAIANVSLFAAFVSLLLVLLTCFKAARGNTLIGEARAPAAQQPV